MKSPIALVVTEIGSQTGWLFEAEHSNGIRALLQRCLQPDQDVLLPKMGSVEAAELFFVVAITDEIGGEAITKRIKKQLDDCEYIDQAGLTISTSYRWLEAITRNASESMESFLDRASIKIQRLIDEEISSRIVGNG